MTELATCRRIANGAGVDGKRCLAHLLTGKERYRTRRANIAVPSPDGQTLAIGTPAPAHGREGWLGTQEPAIGWVGDETTIHSDHGTVSILDSETGKEQRQIAVPDSEVWALAFSPDGKTLAATTGWKEGQIHLFEVETGKALRTIASPPLRTSALAFSPNGATLVRGMADTSVLIWDLRSRE